MDSLLARLSQGGHLVGYPIFYDPKCVINPTYDIYVHDKHQKTMAKLSFIIYITKRRREYEPTENCIFVTAIMNLSGYKGMGADLMKLLIYETERIIKLPIVLTASGDSVNIHKLFNFYEKLGFTAVKNTTKKYENVEIESKDYRLDCP